MLQVVSKFICFLIMYIASLNIVKRITERETKITKSSYLYIILFALATVFLHKEEYTAIYTIMIFLLNIVVYKSVFKLDLSQATIVGAMLMMILTISDVAVTTILRIFFTQEEIRINNVLSVLANFLIAILGNLIVSSRIVLLKLRDFYNNARNKKPLLNIVYLIMLIIGFVYIVYNFANSKIYSTTSMSYLIILASFSVITYIYIDSKNDYKVLSDEYDVLFNYIQNFEEWIEKEQLNRHEYKNQLAVLRTVAKDKKVKSKIDEILDDNINIEDEVVNKLKDLPKGGLKGLMYYKAAIAKKKKINLVVDVSLKSNSKLKKLDESQMKTICKLIGIYFDNAIEAAAETRNKYLLLEVYELKDKINIVISNSFNMPENFSDINKKGISTKGEGRGNGLYYANNILSKNKWLESKQEVIDDYYIQTLSIKKLD
ncbi:MAG: GHKL domain-containing protein [Bacilli bacterium]|nr:GHKL domain-containing protein [Bacilli bacterium]